MTEDLESRVKNATQGITLQTKPDERRRFLGSLRERALVRIDNTEIENQTCQKLFLDHLDDFKGYTVLINAKLPNNNFINKVESDCSKNGINLTLVSNETAQTGAKNTALLVVSKEAINKPRIGIKHVYPPEMPKDELPKPKQLSIWKKLFYGEKK